MLGYQVVCAITLNFQRINLAFLVSFLETGSPAAQINLSLHSLRLARNSKSCVYLQPGAQAQSDLSQPWRASANPKFKQQFPDYVEGDGSLVLSIRGPGANRDRAQRSRPISSGQGLGRAPPFSALSLAASQCARFAVTPGTEPRRLDESAPW